MSALPPYGRLRAIEREARKRHPNALKVHAGWAPTNEHDVFVEVWERDEVTGALRGRVYA